MSLSNMYHLPPCIPPSPNLQKAAQNADQRQEDSAHAEQRHALAHGDEHVSGGSKGFSADARRWSACCPQAGVVGSRTVVQDRRNFRSKNFRTIHIPSFAKLMQRIKCFAVPSRRIRAQPQRECPSIHIERWPRRGDRRQRSCTRRTARCATRDGWWLLLRVEWKVERDYQLLSQLAKKMSFSSPKIQTCFTTPFLLVGHVLDQIVLDVRRCQLSYFCLFETDVWIV